jgi:hypothetical protein
LAEAVLGRIPAASMESFNTKFRGVDPPDDTPYFFSDIGCGGVGARPTMEASTLPPSRAETP